MEKIRKQWRTTDGNLSLELLEDRRPKARLKGLLQPRRTVDVPVAQIHGLYEPVPLKLRANQRILVTNTSGEVLINR